MEKACQIENWIKIGKINKEVGGMRKEFRQDLEKILWEVKGEGEKWECKLEDMKKTVERDMREMKITWRKDIDKLDKKIVDIKDEMKRGEDIVTNWDKNDDRNSLTKGIEENKRHIGLLFEEVDNCRRKWEEKFLELQEGTEERIKLVYEKCNVRFDYPSL